MLFLIAFGLVLVFAVGASAVIRLPTRPAFLCGIVVLAFANIVLVCEIAATFHLLRADVGLLM